MWGLTFMCRKTWLDRFVALQAQYQAFWKELADEKLSMLLIRPEQGNPKGIIVSLYFSS